MVLPFPWGAAMISLYPAQDIISTNNSRTVTNGMLWIIKTGAPYEMRNP
jgi:hypothetical protein